MIYIIHQQLRSQEKYGIQLNILINFINDSGQNKSTTAAKSLCVLDKQFPDEILILKLNNS